MVIGDYLQLLPVRGRLIFSRFASGYKINQLLPLQLWDFFKCAELIEVVRETNQTFSKVLNNLHRGTINENTEKILKSRFIGEFAK